MKRGQSRSAPKYPLHKATGQARVTIHGKTYYLGNHGSEASQQKYKQLIADVWTPPGITPKQQPAGNTEVVTLSKVLTEFRKYSIAKHGEESQEWKYQIDPFRVHDFHATLLHLLGIDHERLVYKFKGRNFRLADVHGHVVEKIFA